MNWNFFSLVLDGVEAFIGGPVITGTRLSRLGFLCRSLALRARCHCGWAFCETKYEYACGEENEGKVLGCRALDRRKTSGGWPWSEGWRAVAVLRRVVGKEDASGLLLGSEHDAR